MTVALQPTSPDQVLDLLRWAAAEGVTLEPVGGGSKRGLGRPVAAAHVLDLSRLSGILLYEPEELVMAARPGTPLAEIEAALAARGQMLAFEPPALGPLLGVPPESAAGGTIGGAFACALSGPRRIKDGAARDHLLGFAAVGGRGEAFKSGGRVVKNVTGYDLSKLMTGAFGTLGVFTQLTFKVMPAPETTATLLLPGLDEAAGVRAMTRALQSPCEVAGAAHLPPQAAARSTVEALRHAVAGATALRLEGFAPSVAARRERLRRDLAAFGAASVLGRDESLVLWREGRDAAALLPDAPVIWRLSVPPAAGAALAARLPGDAQDRLFDWGGGLIWLALPPDLPSGEDARAVAIRAALAETGGHATLIRAPEAVRAAVPVFQPLPPALSALTARIKDAFDPRRILNPGRMHAGI